MTIETWVATVVGLALLAAVIWSSRILANVGGAQVGILERRYLGRALPQGRVVAMRGEIGYQARSLQPGLHILTPYLFGVSRQPMTVVREEEEIGRASCRERVCQYV